MIRVRFAPSPTGFLHIGGARTALFNWMYAKAQGGQLVLRIEDTDQVRSKKEFLDEILDSMKWLGFLWDELYCQSERFETYREYAKKLLEEGKAYKEGEAVILKMSAIAKKDSGETSPSADGGPIQEVKLYDLIRGEISFDTDVLKDEVLMKSDGSPTYSFACVVDDALMNISHVIRGEDHISNTPKQIIMYQALGFKVPKFAHLPLIMGSDGGRLSKRTGAVAVSDYKKEGFLPEALVNYLMLLGWSPGDNQEVININSAIKKFSIKKVNKAAAVFSLDKLKWVNAQHIKQKGASELVELLVPFLQEKGLIGDDYNSQWLENIVELYKGRMDTFDEFVDRTDFLFSKDLVINDDLLKEFDFRSKIKEFALLKERFSSLGEFTLETTEKAFRDLVAELGIKSSELVHPVRVALSGKKVGPGLFDTIVLLGKKLTIKRLDNIKKLA